MRFLKLALSSIFVLCTYLFAFSQVVQKPTQVPGLIVVRMNDSQAKVDDLSELLLQFNVKYAKALFPMAEKPVREFKNGHKTIDLTRYIEIQLADDAQKSQCILALNKSGFVEYAEPRYIPELLYIPDDPQHSNQYYLQNVMAYDGWDIHKGDSATVIAIVDTGLDMDHEDLIYTIAYNYDDPIDGIDNDNDGFVDNFRGWDMGDNDNFPQNEMNEHGTLCAGMAAADSDNGLGVVGTGFDCSILPVKVQDEDSLLSRAYEGIIYAADQGADVINCSWGNTYFAQFEQDVVQYAAINRDALVVASAGNDHNDVNFYPASYDFVLSVAGTTSTDEKWTPENGNSSGGSSYGYFVDVAAPAIRIMTTSDGGDYRQAYAGTSFSGPIVAGVAGIVRSYYPQMSALQAIEHLKNSTDVIDTIPFNQEWKGLLGTGRINMLKALSEPIKPGLVFQNITIFDDRVDDYQNTRMVEITGDLFNYLRDASNVTIQANVLSNNASVITPTIDLGSVDSLQAVSVESGNLQLELDDPVAYDDKVIVELEITADDFSRIQYVVFYTRPSYRDISNGDMHLSVPSNGMFGFVDYSRQIGNGLNYLEFRDLFYDAAWVMGTSEDALLDAFRVDNSFSVLQTTQQEDHPLADEFVYGEFRAYNIEAAINLNVQQKVYAWNDLPNLFLIDLAFVNQNMVDLNDFYASLFVDWDLFKSSRNRIIWDDVKDFAYAEHTGDVNLFGGFKLLSDVPLKHYAMDQLVNGDGLVDLTNGLSSEEKFYCMTHTNHSAGATGDGSDIVQSFGFGPINLPTEDTVHIVLGMLVGQSFYEMQTAVDSLQARYALLYPDESGISISGNALIDCFPNPSNGMITVSIRQSGTQSGTLHIYNMYGGLVYQAEVISGEKLMLPLENGVYHMSFENNQVSIMRKLVISKP